MQPYVDAVGKVAGAGYDNIALLQIGEDQEGFLHFWEDELGRACATGTDDAASGVSPGRTRVGAPHGPRHPTSPAGRPPREDR